MDFGSEYCDPTRQTAVTAKVRRPEKILLVMTPSSDESLGPRGLANSVASMNQDLVRQQEEAPWVQITPRSRFNPEPECQEELVLRLQ